MLIVAAVAVAGIGYFIYAYFQVRHVSAEGNAMYIGPYITALADVPEGTHMFQVDKDAVKNRIENAEPYLQVVSVRQQYPDTVVIQVAERRPVALLPYGAQYVLTDLGAVALETVSDPFAYDMPIVTGITVNSIEIGSPIVTEDEFKIAVMQEILQELNARDLFGMIESVDLSNVNNIILTSSNGLPIRFGQAEKVQDKVKWIANRLPALEREGQAEGTLDVSAGSFATYTMIDGASPSPSPSRDGNGPEASSPDEGEDAGEGSAEPEESSGSEPPADESEGSGDEPEESPAREDPSEND